MCTLYILIHPSRFPAINKVHANSTSMIIEGPSGRRGQMFLIISKGQRSTESRKTTRLNFNSAEFQLLNFNYDSLLDNENALLTFDLLGLSKTVIPFFH